MANYKQLIPFIFHFSSGVYGKNGSDLRLPLEEQFELAKKRGWSDDPDDPGGATMVDVTISTYSTFRKRKGLSLPTKADLRGISFEEWAEILKTMYWDRWRADEIADPESATHTWSQARRQGRPRHARSYQQFRSGTPVPQSQEGPRTPLSAMPRSLEIPQRLAPAPRRHPPRRHLQNMKHKPYMDTYFHFLFNDKQSYLRFVLLYG